MIEDETKIRYLTGRKLSDNTIAQRVVACRLFYDFLMRKSLRTDPVNPVARGNNGSDGQRPARGPPEANPGFHGCHQTRSGNNLYVTSCCMKTPVRKR